MLQKSIKFSDFFVEDVQKIIEMMLYFPSLYICLY